MLDARLGADAPGCADGRGAPAAPPRARVSSATPTTDRRLVQRRGLSWGARDWGLVGAGVMGSEGNGLVARAR
ncbi:MAG: hypothetical protein C0468_01470 [Planctomyces sp.]|nr:hypothetical protein [Planctomyces sp.]